MKKIFNAFLGLLLGLSSWAWVPAASAQVPLSGGDLIKMDSNPSVYYFGHDGKRYVFPNDKAYFTWYSGFSGVKTISADQLAGISLGGNVTYKPAVKMVKITTDPKVYAVSKNGILRPIASESVAAGLYGADWNKKIDDVPDAFFINYRLGEPIAAASGYDKNALLNGVPSISVDKFLANPPAGFVDIRQSAGFVPSSTTIMNNGTVTWIAVDDSRPFVASNPHPAHTDTPSLQSGTLRMGETWSFTFTSTGTKGYHNHNFPSQGGSVTVQ